MSRRSVLRRAAGAGMSKHDRSALILTPLQRGVHYPNEMETV